MYEQRFNPFAANVTVVKGYFKSGRVLALGVLNLISLALSFLTVLTRPMDAMFYQYFELLNQMGVDTSEMASFFREVPTAAKISSVIPSAIIPVLVIVAYFMIFAKSNSKDPDANPVAGVTILLVLSVIFFVFSVIFAVITSIIFVLAAIFGGSAIENLSSTPIDPNGMAAVMVVWGILLAILLFLLLFTAASTKNFYRSVRRSLSSVQLENKGARAYGVLNIIAAVVSGFSLIGAVITTVRGPISLDAFLPFASAGVSFAVLILNASLALGYARYINGYKYGYNDPSAPANAYVPASSGQNPYAQQPYGDGYSSYSAPVQPKSYNDGFTGTKAEPAFCPQCGAPVDPSAPYCSNCGNKL